MQIERWRRWGPCGRGACAGQIPSAENLDRNSQVLSPKWMVAYLAIPDPNHPWRGLLIYFGGVVVVVLLVAWWANSRGND